MNRFFLRGFLLWLVGTVVLRILPARAGAGPPGAPLVLTVFVASFFLFYLALGLRIARGRPPEEARGALIALVLPTLVLDAFSSAFFSEVFPNLPPSAAGAFGGWMLICCAGCLAAGFARG